MGRAVHVVAVRPTRTVQVVPMGSRTVPPSGATHARVRGGGGGKR